MLLHKPSPSPGIISALLITVALYLSPHPAQASSGAEKPNIIFILVDDMGWGDLGIFFQNQRTEDRRFMTPNLDAFGLEGIQMRQHYVPAPVCAPTRASILTGRHQGHEDVRNNQFDKALSTVNSMGTVLKAAGYRTLMVGKYGLPGGPRGVHDLDVWEAYPTRRGFDEFFGAVTHRDGHSHYPANRYPRGDNELHRGTFPWFHNEKKLTSELKGAYTTDLVTAFTKHWLQAHQENAPEEPFFIYLSHTTPHAALHVPSMAYPMGGGVSGGVQWIGAHGNMINTVGGDFDEWFHPEFANKAWEEQEKRFATMMRRIDDSVGDLIQTLKDLNLDKNTLVVFTSDNGPHRESYLADLTYHPTAFDSYGPFTGIKRDVLEGGIRVPTLARWPESIPAGSMDTAPTQQHDWLATFADVAGLPTPATSDGVSLLPLLTGMGTQSESTVYVEYQNWQNTPRYERFPEIHRDQPRNEMQAIYMEGYKGFRRDIQSHDDDFMIFDVNNDPQETNDLGLIENYGDGLQQRMKDRVLQIRRPNSTASRPYDDEPVPPLTMAVEAARVDWSLYRGHFPWVPQTGPLEAFQTGSRESVELGGIGAVAGDVVEFTGYIHAETTGEYICSLLTSGAGILRIHEALVIDGETLVDGEVATEGSILLGEGYHPFTLTLLLDEAASLQFQVK